MFVDLKRKNIQGFDIQLHLHICNRKFFTQLVVIHNVNFLYEKYSL